MTSLRLFARSALLARVAHTGHARPGPYAAITESMMSEISVPDATLGAPIRYIMSETPLERIHLAGFPGNIGDILNESPTASSVP